MNIQIDRRFMAYTIELALNGQRGGSNPQRAACSVVKNGKLIASSWFGKTGAECPIEVWLEDLQEAFDGACVYLTQEFNTDESDQPPAYVKLLVKSNVVRTVVGAQAFNPKIANKAIQYLRENGVEVEVGVLEKDVESLNRGLKKRYRENRPWVCGMRCIGPDKSEQPIDCENIVLQATLEKTRSNYETILIILPTEVQYCFGRDSRVSISPTKMRNKLVIVDLGEKIGNIEKYLNREFGQIFIFTGRQSPLLNSIRPGVNMELLPLPLDNGAIDWPALIRGLCDRGLNEIIMEVGSNHYDTLLESNVFDELCIFMSPYFGDRKRKLSLLNSEAVSEGWIKINSHF